MRQMYTRFLALIGKANHKHHSICFDIFGNKIARKNQYEIGMDTLSINMHI